MRIAVVLIDRTLPGIQELMDAVCREFGAEVLRETVHLGATHSFRKERNQYDAEILLRELAPFRSRSADITLFIFREDMFVENLNFIFGVAENDFAIVSTARLDPRFYGAIIDAHIAEELFKERLIKEALHELGHTFGLPHCDEKFSQKFFSYRNENRSSKLRYKNRKCVMVFSNSIADVDFKGAEFCENCRKALYRKEYK